MGVDELVLVELQVGDEGLENLNVALEYLGIQEEVLWIQNEENVMDLPQLLHLQVYVNIRTCRVSGVSLLWNPLDNLDM